jgi:hypothetical protein
MALPQGFEKLISLIQDPAEREASRKELESGFLRQEDYSRKMNELTESEKIRAKAYEDGKAWVADNRNYYKEAVGQRDNAIERAKQAEARLAELSNPQKTPIAEPDINVADDNVLAAALKEARTEARLARSEAGELAKAVSRIDKMFADGQIITADKFNDEANRKLEAFGEAILGTVETIARAPGEFGKTIDRKTLLKEAAKLGGDLDRAYDSVTSEFRLEKLKADIRADVTKELEAKYQNNGTPLAGGSAPLELGPLQQRVFQSANPGSTIDANIPADGSGRLAHAIAAELRAEGKY